jgi:3-dehydroquinate dehydratase-2
MATARRGGTAAIRILVVHGPNLNLLGEREPALYGSTTLRQIDAQLRALGTEFGVRVESFQSNSEGELVGRIQAARAQVDGVIINPAAYTHSSIAIRDALAVLKVPMVEVHLSNIYRREPFRHHSTIADLVDGRIVGLGAAGYALALRGLIEIIQARHQGRRPREKGVRREPANE